MSAWLASWWDRVPSKYRKYLVWVLVGASIGLILYLFVSNAPEKKPGKRVKKLPREIFVSKKIQDKMGVSGMSWEIEHLQKEHQDMQTKLEKLERKQESSDKPAPPDLSQIQAEIDRKVKEQIADWQQQQQKSQEKAQKPEKAERRERARKGTEEVEWWKDLEKGRSGKAGEVDWSKGAQESAGEPALEPKMESGGQSAAGIKVIDGSKSRESGQVQAVRDKKQDKEETTFLLAGSIFSGTLITGLDVSCSGSAKNDPFPVLLRVKKEAILPNRYSADVRECFLIAAGWGDMSSERAYLRSERLSCIREDGKAIETKIDMYAVGEDGKAGARGRLVSKTGAILSKALMAGFMEGFSRLFSRQPVTIIGTGQYGQSTVTPFQRNLSKNALEGAGIEGLGSALDRLSNYYMDMAENIFPVIEIDAGRAIDFVLISGVSLKLEGKGT